MVRLITLFPNRKLSRVPAALLLAVVAITTSSAHADTAAMLPVSQSARISQATRDEAGLAVARGLARENVTVTSAHDTELRLVADPSLRACSEHTCAERVARTIGVDFAVLVTVWTRGETSEPLAVSVAFVTPDGAAYGGEGDVARAGNLAAAAERAVFEARQRQRTGSLGRLRVETDPPGAVVEIDGIFRGETPFYRMIEPGPHNVVVHREGFVNATRSVSVNAQTDAVVRVTLERPGQSSAVVAPHTGDPVRTPRDRHTQDVDRTEAHWLNFVVGGALAAGAIAMVFPAVDLASRNGQCAPTSDLVAPSCPRILRSGDAAFGYAIGAGVLGALGALLLIGQPIRVGGSVSADGAFLDIGGPL